MKRLFLIFHGRFPSEKAASLFAAKSCEAFADEGVMVTLLVPRRLGVDRRDPYEFYGIRKNFRIVYLPTIDLLSLSFFTRFSFWLSLVVFSWSCLIYIVTKSKKTDIVYSNEHIPIFLASLVRKNTFYEVHDMPRGGFVFYKNLFKRVRGVIVTNTWKRENLARMFGVPEWKMFREMNAVDVREFDIPMTQAEAREKLHISREVPLVLYTGHLYSWKGVDTLALAAEVLPPDTPVYFVGGTESDVASFRERFGSISNVEIVGYKNHKEMPLWQRAADVVVVPNTAKEDISKYDTSPMKIFEYMASKRPIVATDLPSIREILNESNAVIVDPDDPGAMAKGIMLVLGDKERAQKTVDQAFHDVALHTWGARAKRILRFVGDTCTKIDIPRI